MRSRRRILSVLPAIALLWLIIAGILVIEAWPHVPDSPHQWVLFLIFGPPVYVLVEAFGEFIFSLVPKRIEARHGFSWARIFWYLLVIFIALGTLFVLLWLLSKLV